MTALPPFLVISRHVRYDPESGHFFRRSTGKRADFLRIDGYARVSIERKTYAAHRLAWLLYFGEPPSKQIDHINGNRADNRISNLRLATVSQNSANRKALSISGFKGVYRARNGRWNAEIKVSGRQQYLGQYATPELASAAYLARAMEVFGEYARAF